MNALGVAYASSSDDDEGSGTESASLSPSSLRVQAAGALPAQKAPTTTTTTQHAIVIEGLPDEPPGPADPEVQARIARFLELQRAPGAKSFQENLQTKKDVANPYILSKVVEYFGIDELHSNFDRAVFDPHGLPLHEYTDKLAVEQKRRHDERLAQQQQQSQLARTQIAFTQAKQSH